MVDNIPVLLGWAVLLPLISFVVILLFGPRLGKAGSMAGWVATLAIVGAGVLSFASLAIWLNAHPPLPLAHGDHGAHGEHESHGGHGADHADDDHGEHSTDKAGDADHAAVFPLERMGHGGGLLAEPADEPATDGHADGTHGEGAHGEGHAEWEKPYLTGDWWTLGQFGKLKLTIGYYVDALTVAMFCMVTLIASCIHFYAMGYMHDELHDFTDPEVTTRDGTPFTRPGRYHRFFQALSLFCFSMLGLVIAGNIAMTFVFWELVGICSYFLIGFYVERPSA
ncbi:MAG: NADH-quinone oxidoreductase subunit L, partial [Planctomycetota bacterium]